jgi:CBS domain-containing membrane protein
MASFPPSMPSKIFAPLLAGARFPDRLMACLGALLGIALTSLVSASLPLGLHNLPLLVAPIGASAVLLFAIPASPLAQPWPIIGGNTISALVGVCMVRLVPDQVIAAGLAVACAILVMSLLRCLHPPGGAAALTTVIGGPAIVAAGFSFPFVPIALNSALLVGLGWTFHKFSQHSYPHKPVAIAETPEEEAATLIDMTDLDKALEELGESFDVGRADLEMLLHRAEIHARRRAGMSEAAEGKFRVVHVMNDAGKSLDDTAA